MMTMDGKGMAIDARDVLTTAEWFIAAGTLMTAIALGIRKMYRVARNVEESLKTVSAVKEQLEPNGGNSLYDKISHLGDVVKVNAERAKAVDEKLDDLSQRVRNLEGYHMEKAKP